MKLKSNTVFILLLLIALVCIVVGTKMTFSNGYNITGANIGRAGYILFGFVVIIWVHIQEIKEGLFHAKHKRDTERHRQALQ